MGIKEINIDHCAGIEKPTEVMDKRALFSSNNEVMDMSDTGSNTVSTDTIITPDIAEYMLMYGTPDQQQEAFAAYDEGLRSTGATEINSGLAFGKGISDLATDIANGFEILGAHGTAFDLQSSGMWSVDQGSQYVETAINDTVARNEGKEDFWNDLYNTDFVKKINELSYIKKGDAFYEGISGAAVLGGYIGMSFNPAGWMASSASVVGDTYENVLKDGGTINDAYMQAAPMAILDFGLNAVGGGAIGGIIAKGSQKVIASGKSAVASCFNKISELVDGLKKIKPDFEGAISETGAVVGRVNMLLADERGFLNLGNLFGKKTAGVLDEAVEKTSSIHALPKREGYTTLTEDDFVDFANGLIKKLEADASLTVKPTLEKVKETFWLNFSKIAEQTYFESNTLKYLDDLVKDENMVVAIHKTGSASSDAIKNIMDEGLYVHGANLQGITQTGNAFPGVSKTATVISDKKGLAESLQSFYISPSDFSGKGSRNSIIVAYPKGLSESDVVQKVDGVWSIKPEYIVGYVPAGESGEKVAVEGIIRNPKWYGIKNTEEDLIDASKLPLSDLEDHRTLQEKWIKGEPVSKLAGRDAAQIKFGNYDLKSDHAYRATSYKALEDYMANNAIRDNGMGKGYANVDWYIGGASSNYGRVIIEAPAKKSYFTLTDHYGGVMSGHPFIRQAHTSNVEPMPFDEVTKIIFLDKKGGNKVLKIVDTATDNVADGVKEGNLLSLIDYLEYKKSVLKEKFPVNDQTKLDEYWAQVNEIRSK